MVEMDLNEKDNVDITNVNNLIFLLFITKIFKYIVNAISGKKKIIRICFQKDIR